MNQNRSIHLAVKKTFADESPQEKVFRKTLEIIERPFTTEPKKPRIRRGHTIVIRRCREIMKHLWQTDHKKVASKEDVESAVFYCVGGDYRTLKKYVGFDIYKKGIFQKRVLGHLERLRYVEKIGNGKYLLNHYLVPEDYHYHEELVSPLESPFPIEMNTTVSKPVLCVRSGNHEVRGKSEGLTTLKQQNNNNNNTTHTNQLSESILTSAERRILDAATKEVH